MNSYLKTYFELFFALNYRVDFNNDFNYSHWYNYSIWACILETVVNYHMTRTDFGFEVDSFFSRDLFFHSESMALHEQIMALDIDYLACCIYHANSSLASKLISKASAIFLPCY